MKIFKAVIGVVILVALAWGIINFKKIGDVGFIKSTLGKIFGFVEEGTETFKHNLSFTVSPERKRPLSFATREAKLANFIPSVFGQFSPAQWEEFWNLVFEPIEVKEGRYMKKRYRTKEEIESYLKYNYSNPFSRFGKMHWDYFWSIVLNEKL